jgi:hypothetical protein
MWQVWLNGKAVSGVVYLPGTFKPMAITESWNGGSPACNGFAYKFDHVAIATRPGVWRPLTHATKLADPGYEVHNRTAQGFVATGG